MQSRLVAATFSGKIPRPSLEKMQANVEALNKAREECHFAQGVLFTVLCESIGEDLGVIPSFWKALWNAKKLLFRPIPACYYRTFPEVDGEETAEKFTKLFEKYMSEYPTKVDKTA
jgi:hypothetical protein